MKTSNQGKSTSTEGKQREQVARAILKTIRDLEKLERLMLEMEHKRLMPGIYGKKGGGTS